jgi:hypothetical protein
MTCIAILTAQPTLAADLSCGPPTAKDAMRRTKARRIFLHSPSSIISR